MDILLEIEVFRAGEIEKLTENNKNEETKRKEFRIEEILKFWEEKN